MTLPLADPKAHQQALLHAEHMLSFIEAMLRFSLPQPEEAAEAAEAEIETLRRLVSQCIEEASAAELELPEARVTTIYHLAPIERDILWLAVATHLDPTIRHWICRVNDSILHDYVDGALCLALFCSSRMERLQARAALSPGAPLLASGLLEMVARDDGAANQMLHEMVPAGHLISYLGGRRALSPKLARVARLIEPAFTLDEIPLAPAVRQALEPLLSGFFNRAAPSGDWYCSGGVDFPNGIGIVLHGAPGSGRTLSLKALAGSLKRNVILVDGNRLGELSLAGAKESIFLMCQEAELYGDLVIVRNASAVMAAGRPMASILTTALSTHASAVVLCIDEAVSADPVLERVIILRQPFDAKELQFSSSFIWQVNVPGECIIPPSLNFEDSTGHLVLTPAQIRKAAHLAYLLSPAQKEDGEEPLEDGEKPPPSFLLDSNIVSVSARAQLDTSAVKGLTQSTETELSFDDLILPEKTAEQLQDILGAVGNRKKVLYTWGLGVRIKRGIGFCCLFDGDPGTGKTLSAEVIASELGLTLLRVNIAGIIDKYIGETEKNLTRIFESVRSDTHLLLFDEADSLFSRRTEVKRSTDRYSNMDINVLLQLVERYEGVAVLTTNLKKGIDVAFERRIQFKVNFPLPGPEERELIWKRLLPERVPTSGEIHYPSLAKVELSGGEIKNAIIRAAYTAANRDTLLDMDFLFDAARREASATGRLVRDF